MFTHKASNYSISAWCLLQGAVSIFDLKGVKYFQKCTFLGWSKSVNVRQAWKAEFNLRGFQSIHTEPDEGSGSSNLRSFCRCGGSKGVFRNSFVKDRTFQLIVERFKDKLQKSNAPGTSIAYLAIQNLIEPTGTLHVLASQHNLYRPEQFHASAFYIG